MENNFNVKDLFGLEGIMKLFNTTNISEVVALEKKLINFLTQEQLEEIAKMEKEILNDLVNSKNNYQALQETHRKLVEKLGSIGIDANAILNPPQENESDLDLPKKVEIDFKDLNFEEYDTISEYENNGCLDDDICEYLRFTYGCSVNDYEDYDIDEDNKVVIVYGIDWCNE